MSSRQIAQHGGTSVDAGHVTDIASRRSRRTVSHCRFRRQTSGKGRAPQRPETRMIMNDTTGKPLAMVTGASSGIGRELAARFAEHGYDLVVAAEDERIESAAASLAGQAVQALPVRADLAAGRIMPETAKAATPGAPDRARQRRLIPGKENRVPAELTFIGNGHDPAGNRAFMILTDPNFLHRGEHAYLGYGGLDAIAERHGPVDAAVVHVGGTTLPGGFVVTMTGADAVECLRWIRPRMAVPAHYDDYGESTPL
jgi:short subunit dehydrogenase